MYEGRSCDVAQTDSNFTVDGQMSPNFIKTVLANLMCKKEN